MSTLKIRQMQPQDLAAVLTIQSQCYPGDIPESLESLAAKQAASPSTCFVVVINGNVRGYLIGLPWDAAAPPTLNSLTCKLPPVPNCLYLHDLSVAPDARKSGTGRALIEAFFSRLHQLKIGRANLIAIQNSGSYWRRFGFQPAATNEVLKRKLATYGESAEYLELIY